MAVAFKRLKNSTRNVNEHDSERMESIELLFFVVHTNITEYTSSSILVRSLLFEKVCWSCFQIVQFLHFNDYNEVMIIMQP